MFDLITGDVKHAPRHQAAPLVVSIGVHLAVAAAILATTVLLVTEQLPAPPMMMAFVAAPPPPPPPPPPVPEPVHRPVPQAVPTAGVAPVEPPAEITPEAPVADMGEGEEPGVVGGVPGGIAGGVLGGIETEIPPPPPPPKPRGPVRIGGQIQQPTLIHRVEPVYPGVAVSAGIEGMVILEAIVDEEGRVESLRVLRSQGVLDRPAIEAVKQWRYSPVILNGRPEKFILTVVVSFNIEEA